MLGSDFVVGDSGAGAPIAADMPSLLSIKRFRDDRGCLGVIQHPELPFPCRRMYWLSEPVTDSRRGNHGHLRLRQVLVAVSGTATVELAPLRPGAWKAGAFRLETGGPALYVPAGSWRALRDFSPDAIIIVLASEPYDPDDYVMPSDWHPASKGSDP